MAGAMDMSARSRSLAGWTPTKVEWIDGCPVVRWYFTDGVDFGDPFFEQTIGRCLRDPFRLLFWRETDMQALAELADRDPGLPPAGFMFHTSRCGSTLLTQMFAGLRSTLAMSEPTPIDHVLRLQFAHPAVDEQTIIAWLRLTVAALGRAREPEQTRLVIKLDALAILWWPLIRRAFPDSPFLFLYRDPIEVAASQLAQGTSYMIPGMVPSQWFGITPSDVLSMSAEEYCGAALAALCRRALEAAAAGELTLVNYGSLPDAVYTTIAPLFDVPIAPNDRLRLSAVAGRDAKNPTSPFTADADQKQRAASPALRVAIARFAGPAYQALEALRCEPVR